MIRGAFIILNFFNNSL